MSLFLGYLSIGMLGFGGVNAWSRRVIVEDRRWLTEREYAEILGLGQVLPGPNVGNAAIMVGRRFGGLAGALTATLGLYAAPLAILLLLAGIWDRFGGLPEVQRVMAGVAAAASGMALGNALRMGERLRLPPPMLALAVLAVPAAFWLRLPLPLIVAGLGIPGVWLAWRGARA
ncbi:chromate transporter [Roseomonas sp. BN140053]|uniref:chromate transporter n=1 Tax=Roseomonas sp. BN140053 TaxID=3391898 RepID=UPI0039EC1800